MRAITVLLIIGFALMTGFVLLNINEFTRSSVLSVGFTTVDVPLGLLMLLTVVALLLVFVASTIYLQSVNLIESRQHTRELAAQRELADKAEASRFTALQGYLEAQATAVIARQADASLAFESRLGQTEKLVLRRFDQSDNTTSAYWGQLGDALTQNGRLNAKQ